MDPTFKSVAEIINETCGIPLEKITPQSHAINDLNIDSLDFLEVVFAIDKKFNVRLPLEDWVNQINRRSASVDKYFILENLCASIDKQAASPKEVSDH
jgi:acyl carrier protein